MTGNYFGNMKLGKQLTEKARELAQEREEAETKVAELDKYASLCLRLGFTSTRFDEIAKNAKEKLEAMDYRGAISDASHAISSLIDELNQMFRSRIDSTVKILNFLGSKGSDVEHLNSNLKDVRSLLDAGEFEKADALLTEVWSREEKNVSELYSVEFSKVQRTIVEAKSRGMVLEGVDTLLSSARNEMISNNFENAFRLLDEAAASIVSKFRGSTESQIQSISSKIEISKQFGLGTSSHRERLEQVQALPPEKRFGEIQSLLSSLNRDIDHKLRRAFEVNIKTIRSDMLNKALPPSVISASSLHLNQTEQMLSENDFERAYSTLKQVEADLEKAKYDHIARILLNGKKYISDAIRNGADVSPVNEQIKEVRELMKRRRFDEAVRTAELANEAAKELAEQITRASGLMKTIEAEYAILSARMTNSVDTSIKYADVKRRYAEKDYPGFIDGANLLVSEMRSMLETFSTSQIDGLDRKISALEYLGAETLDLNKLLENAISLVKNQEYNRCLEITARMEEEADSMLLHLNDAWMKKAAESSSSSSGNMRERLEKLMIDATALRAKEEYYRSSCVAKDVVDWSNNGDVYRVNSLVQRTKRLMSVSPLVSSGVAANMIDAAERNLAINVESALKSAGEAHDIMYGLVVDYFANEMSDLMSMISASRRKKVEIGYGYNLIGRARAALKFEDFETATRMVSIAREEIQTKLKHVEEIETSLDRVEKLFIEGKNSGGDLSEVEGMIAEARSAVKRYDYASAGMIVLEVQEKEEKILAPNLAAKEILTMKSLLQLASTLSLDTTDFETVKNEATSLMRERNHYAALVLSRKLVKDIEAVVQNAIDSAIKAVAADSARAELDGIDVKLVESRLVKARELMAQKRFEQAFNSLSLADKELDFSRNAVAETAAAMRTAEEYVEHLDELGIIEGSAIGMLRQSKSLLNNEQHLLALQTAQKCIELCGETLKKKGPQMLTRFVSDFMHFVPDEEIEELNQNMHTLKPMLEAGKPEGASGLLSIKEYCEKVKLQEEMSKRTLEVTASKVDAVTKQGIDTSTISAEIESMKKLLVSRRYREVIEVSLHIEQMVDELLLDSKRAMEKMAKLEQKLHSYEEIGVPVAECREMATGIADIASSGKPAEALSLITACDRKAEDAINSMTLSTLNALEKAGRAADELGIEFRPGITEQAKEAMMEGRLFDSLSLSYTGLKDISFIILETLQASLDRGLEGVNYPASLRSSAMNRLDKFVSDQRYDEAMAYLREIREQASRKAATATAVEQFRSEFQSLSQTLRRAGMNTRNVESRFNTLLADLPDNAPVAAAQIIEEMKKTRNGMLPSFSIEEIKGSTVPIIAVRNRGRAVALDVSIEVKGQSFSMNDAVGNMKPGQERHLNISPSATGEVWVNVKSRSLTDDEERVSRQLFRIDGNSLIRIRVCAHCKGRIRDGLQTYTCGCGREYHVPCSSRLKSCECGLPVRA